MTPKQVPTRDRPIRVVVIDDSRTARELLVALYESAGDMQVVGTGSSGEEAIRLVARLRPDVVSVDVIMPGMNGLEATRRIMSETPTPIVIVTASLMLADIDLAFEALQAGALTAVKKPGLDDPETCQKVVQAVRSMSSVHVVRRWGSASSRTAGKPGAVLTKPVTSAAAAAVAMDSNCSTVQIIGIAASTGGPGTLASILRPLPADFPIPILIVQHVTSGFATGLAQWLGEQTALRVRLAGHGDVPQPGSILLPPDDYHMQLGQQRTIELYKGQPYKGLRPSANYMFHSLAQTYGSRAMGIILTGMGDDGAEGLEMLHKVGGLTIAQEEQSCVVYGMPCEAVLRNAVDRILTPDQISNLLVSLPAAARPDKGKG